MSKSTEDGNHSQQIPGNRSPQWRQNLLLFCLILTVSLGCSELYLAWKDISIHSDGRFWEHPSYDPLLGWINLPGRRLSREENLPKPVYETVWPDGRRATYPKIPIPKAQRILIVGCSFTYGWGVADNETWAWKLAERFPQVTFENFAVYAYGACQSVAMAERQLNTPRHYDWVIYATMHDHPHRDVEPIHAILDAKTQKPLVFGRRAGLDKHGDLYFIPCQPRWFGDDLLRTINFAKQTYYHRETIKTFTPQMTKPEYETKVYIAELKRLNNLAREHNTRLAVFALENDQWANDLNIADNGIDFPFISIGDKYCDQPDSPRFHCNGLPDGHPSGIVHTFWAKKISNWLATQLTDNVPN